MTIGTIGESPSVAAVAAGTEAPNGGRLVVRAIPSGSAPSIREREPFDGELFVRSYPVKYRGVNYQITIRKALREDYNSLDQAGQARVDADMEALKEALICDLRGSTIRTAATIQFHFTDNDGYVAYIPKDERQCEEIEQKWQEIGTLEQYCEPGNFYRGTSESSKRIGGAFVTEDWGKMRELLQASPERASLPEPQPEGAPLQAPLPPLEPSSPLPQDPPIEKALGTNSILRIAFDPTLTPPNRSPAPKKQDSLLTDLVTKATEELGNGTENITLDLTPYELSSPEGAIATLKQVMALCHFALVDNHHGANLTLLLPNELNPHKEALTDWVNQEMSSTDQKGRYGGLVRRSVSFGDCNGSLQVEGLEPQEEAPRRASLFSLEDLKGSLGLQVRQVQRNQEVVVQLHRGGSPQQGVAIHCDISLYACTDEEALATFIEALETTGIQQGERWRLLCSNETLIGSLRTIDAAMQRLQEAAPARERAAAERAAAERAAQIRRGRPERIAFKTSQVVAGKMRLSIFKSNGERPPEMIMDEAVIRAQLRGGGDPVEIVVRGAQEDWVNVVQEAFDTFYRENRGSSMEIKLIVDDTTDDNTLNQLIDFFNQEIVAPDFMPETSFEGKVRYRENGVTVVGANLERIDQTHPANHYERGTLATWVKIDLNEFRETPTSNLIFDCRWGKPDNSPELPHTKVCSYDLREFDEMNPYSAVLSALAHYRVPKNGTVTIILPDMPKARKAMRKHLPPPPPRREELMRGLRSLWS